MSARLTPLAVLLGVVVALACLTFVPAVQAETIEIVTTGFDFTYDGSMIFDAMDQAGRNLDAAEADSVSSVMFSVDAGNENDTTMLYADLLIGGVDGISEFGGFDNSSTSDSFGLDLFSTDAGAWSLQMNLSKVKVVFAGPDVAVAIFGKATSVPGQSLPFGLPDIDTTKDVQVTIVSGSLSNVQTSGGMLTGFDASNGVVTISAALVPEPSQYVGLISMAVLMGGYFWRRRRS